MFETNIEKAISKASKVSLRYQLRIFIENKETGDALLITSSNLDLLTKISSSIKFKKVLNKIMTTI